MIFAILEPELCRPYIYTVVNWPVFMAALWNRAGHYICALWFLLSFYILSIFFPRLISAVADWMSDILAHMVWS